MFVQIFFEEAVIHGMSLSEEGFCVILRGLVCDRYLRVNVSPYDPMSDGLDQEQADTPVSIFASILFTFRILHITNIP